MPSLTIRDIPAVQLRRIKAKAVETHRSLNGQILAMIDFYLGSPEASAPAAVQTRSRKARQAEALRELAGTWEDSRTSEEIIRDIRDSRTTGREVSL